MAIHIITDGSSDLTPELAEQFGINIVPLYVHFEQESCNSNMDAGNFYDKMKGQEELPKTSSPSPGDFLNIYQSLDSSKDILVLCMTSQLSSTYNHALMAKDLYEEEGHPNRVVVIDSKTASIGLGLLAIRASIMAKAGDSLHEMQAKIKQCIIQTKTYFTLDTLENVIRGGRLSRIKGTVASMLNIKLLMCASEEGAIDMMEKVRGTQRALKRLIEKVGDAWHHADQGWVAFAHSNCEERAKKFMDEFLDKYPFDNVMVVNMGPVIGTYAGEGGILVTFQAPTATS
ncbi:DegV family protein [Paenibacillus marinisediminis]